MSSSAIRVLLVADTHLGFDLPLRPRIERRRRGYDFLANLNRALQPALTGEVDLVVHGGDLFDRSKAPAALVDIAMAPLIRAAEAGTPVYLVPGNHERSSIPLHLWTAHPNLHIFDRPRTFLYSGLKGSIALSGFPFAKKVRDLLPKLASQTGYKQGPDVPHLLCMHQTIEGAKVGISNYTFRSGPDVVAGQDLPPGFSAVLSGHIHRAQVLTHDLNRRRLATSVVYPGSVERTSFVERNETKGYMIVTLRAPGHKGNLPADISFVPLPARPMVSLSLEPNEADGQALKDQLVSRLRSLDPNSVVRVQVHGPLAVQAFSILSAEYLRSIAPLSMNIALAVPRAAY
jgi:DNA repair protein SbcD/Mre11